MQLVKLQYKLKTIIHFKFNKMENSNSRPSTPTDQPITTNNSPYATWAPKKSTKKNNN